MSAPKGSWSAWHKTQTEGEKTCIGSVHEYVSLHTEWQRPSLYARDCFGNSCEVTARHSINGSGSENGHFGGAERWPAVSLRVDLPEGRNDLREQLCEALMRTVDTFLKANHLDVEK